MTKEQARRIINDLHEKVTDLEIVERSADRFDYALVAQLRNDVMEVENRLIELLMKVNDVHTM